MRLLAAEREIPSLRAVSELSSTTLAKTSMLSGLCIASGNWITFGNKHIRVCVLINRFVLADDACRYAGANA
jgi:hypothetical protein